MCYCALTQNQSLSIVDFSFCLLFSEHQPHLLYVFHSFSLVPSFTPCVPFPVSPVDSQWLSALCPEWQQSQAATTNTSSPKPFTLPLVDSITSLLQHSACFCRNWKIVTQPFIIRPTILNAILNKGKVFEYQIPCLFASSGADLVTFFRTDSYVC